MNCFNHPNQPAVAQCADCGKGLCRQCASQYTIPICQSCNDKRKGSDTVGYIKPLVICIILYIIGYNLEIMGPDHAFGGYMLMCAYAGWKFIGQFIPNIFLIFNLSAIFWYYLIRLVISMFIGAFVTPFYLGWCIYKLVRTLTK